MIRLSRGITVLLALVLLPAAFCLAAGTTFIVMSAVAERYDRLPPPVDENAAKPLLFRLQEPPPGQVFMGVVVTIRISGLGATGWMAGDYSLLQGTRPLRPVGVLLDKGRFFPTPNVNFRRLSATASAPAMISPTAKATIFYAVPKDATDLVFKAGGHDTKLALPAKISSLDQRDFYDVKIKGARVVDKVQYKPKPAAAPVDYTNAGGKLLLVTADVLAKDPDAGGGWSIHWCWCNVAWAPDKTAPCLGTYDAKKNLLDTTDPAVGTRAIMSDNRMPTKPVSVVLCFPIAADAKDFSLTILGYEVDKGHVPD